MFGIYRVSQKKRHSNRDVIQITSRLGRIDRNCNTFFGTPCIFTDSNSGPIFAREHYLLGENVGNLNLPRKFMPQCTALQCADGKRIPSTVWIFLDQSFHQKGFSDILKGSRLLRFQVCHLVLAIRCVSVIITLANDSSWLIQV